MLYIWYSELQFIYLLYPKIELGNSLKSIKVSGIWFMNKPEGRTPIVRHALKPYAISFTHQWNLK